MLIRIRTKNDVHLFTAGVALLATVLSEACVLGLYFFGGSTAFHMDNAILFAGIVPVIVSVPITYATASMSLRLHRAHRELRRLADTDSLTALPNRRSFFSAAEALLANAEAANNPCALLVIDADYFKELNDSYGHATGDRALVMIADVLREKFRQSDLICRVGGEEFAVLIPDMDAQTARPLAQRLVEAVAASPLSEAQAVIEFSISCGIADTHCSYHLPTLFKSADDAMYQAKHKGRNRVALLEAVA